MMKSIRPITCLFLLNLICCGLWTVDCGPALYAQSPGKFNGLDMNMGNLSRLSDAQTRSISAENMTGEKGKGGMADPVRDKGKKNLANSADQSRELGVGWKVNPYLRVEPKETITLANIEGPGALQHIWMTPTGN